MQTRRALPNRRTVLASIAAAGAFAARGARADDTRVARPPGADHRALSGRRLNRRAHAHTGRTAERHIWATVRDREPGRRRRQYRHCGGHEQRARWLHHRRRDDRTLCDQPVPLQQDALRRRTRHDPCVDDLGIAQRLRGGNAIIARPRRWPNLSPGQNRRAA